MKLGICLFFFLCFSLEGKADLFSSKMNLKEKVKLTRQIGEQTSIRSTPLDQKKRSSLTEQNRLIKKNRMPLSVNNGINYSVKQVYVSEKDKNNIRMILGLPLENRKQALSRYHSFSFHVLKQFVFSKKEAMSIRWKALTSVARLHPEKAYPVVQAALRDKNWFLRNAGLIAMEIINSKESVRWAGELLNDPSLVVRTAAVAMIKKHKASHYKVYLLGKLNASDSFHKKKSLWIRHHIVSTLADFCEPGEERMFISFLHDPDKRLHGSSIAALEKLTGKTFRSSEERQEIAYEEEQEQKNKWISWWSESRYKNSSVQL